MKLMQFLLGSMCVMTLACTTDKQEENKEVKEQNPVVEKVNGPRLEGEWFSNCIVEGEGESLEYFRVHLKIEGEDFSHSQTKYADDMCFDELDSESFTSTFRYLQNLGEGVFSVQLKLTSDTKVKPLKEFNIRSQDRDLLLSEFYTLTDDPKEYRTKWLFSRTYMGPNPSYIPNLKPGLYEPKGSHASFCDQALSTQKVNGVVSEIYIDLLGDCKGQLILSCKDRFCKEDRYRLIIRSEYSYEFINLSSGERVVFQKR